MGERILVKAVVVVVVRERERRREAGLWFRGKKSVLWEGEQEIWEEEEKHG